MGGGSAVCKIFWLVSSDYSPFRPNICEEEKFMAPFYGRGSTASRVQSHYKETVYFLPLSSQKLLVLILSSSEGWKAESTLELPSGFKHRTPGSVIQHLKPPGHCSSKGFHRNFYNHFKIPWLSWLISTKNLNQQ